MWNLVNISVHFRIVRCFLETRKHCRINTIIKYYLKVWCSRIWHRMILWYLFKTDLAICFQRRCSEQGLKCIITSLAKTRGSDDPRLILLVSLCMAQMWCNWLYHRYVVWNRWYMAPIVSHVRQQAHPRSFACFSIWYVRCLASLLLRANSIRLLFIRIMMMIKHILIA